MEAHQRAVAHYDFLTKRLTDKLESLKKLETQATEGARCAPSPIPRCG